MEDYKSIQVGDRVKFKWIRDPRITKKLEYHTGVVVNECIDGWQVRIGGPEGPIYGIKEVNYISHKKGKLNRSL